MSKGTSGAETILLVLLAVLITIFILKSQATSTYDSPMAPIASMASMASTAPTAPVIVNVKGGDDRYSIAPRPQQVWNAGPDLSVVRSNPTFDPMFTSGIPDAYQQMGVISGEDGKVLPLYGRRTGPRSDRFNYYTRTDTYNPVALPVAYKKRDCQDGVGCDEVMNGDEVRLGATGQAAKVTLYGLDGPRYVG